MGSLGTGELLVIAIVALVVFGPKRLPELARKAGELLAKARAATRSLTESMESEYSDIAAPLQTLKSEYDATMSEIKNMGTTVSGMQTTLPGGDVDRSDEEADSSQLTPDSSDEEADSSQLTPDSSDEEAEEADSSDEEATSSQPTPDSSQLTADSSDEEADSSQLTPDSSDEEAEEAEEEAVSSQPKAQSSDEEATSSQLTADSSDEETGEGGGDDDTVDRMPSPDEPSVATDNTESST